MISFSRFLVLAMSLVFLLTSAGGSGFSVKKWVHDLGHHEQVNSSATDYAPAGLLTVPSDGVLSSDVAASAAELEHRLLHTVNAVQLFAVAVANVFWAPARHVLSTLAHTYSLPVALLEAPFRPPRASGSI